MATPSFLTMGLKSEPQLVVVVAEERECAAWTRAMRMPRRGRVGTAAAGDGGRGVIVLAIGYHRYRCRCHWETRDKGLGLVWFVSAACSPTPPLCPLSLLLHSAALVAMAARPLDSTPPAEVDFLGVELWTVVPCSLWRTRFAAAPTTFSCRRSHTGAAAAMET
uniref:Uncharacterized protein n=1 Tax=Oryza rufipogon TaxID=4529 RepID=A0A0E0PXG4_ORYRU